MSNELNALMIAFAVQWHPFGDAADEDIFTTFGISPAEYGHRLSRALHLPDAPPLNELTKARIVEYARGRQL